jgi:hypothetical protein
MKLIFPEILAAAALAGFAALTPSLADLNTSPAEKRPPLPRLIVPPSHGEAHTGELASRVAFHSNPFGLDGPTLAAFDAMPAFVALDRLAASMDRDMDDLLRQVATLERFAAVPAMTALPLQMLPAGGTSYSLVSETVGNRTCTRMVQITQRAPGEKPQIVSQASGNCGAANAPAPDSGPASLKAINADMTAAPVATRTAL